MILQIRTLVFVSFPISSVPIKMMPVGTRPGPGEETTELRTASDAHVLGLWTARLCAPRHPEEGCPGGARVEGHPPASSGTSVPSLCHSPEPPACSWLFPVHSPDRQVYGGTEPTHHGEPQGWAVVRATHHDIGHQAAWPLFWKSLCLWFAAVFS